MSVSPYICLASRASGIKPPWSPHFFSNTAPAMADPEFLEEPDPTSPYPAATVWSPKRRAHAQGLVNVTILRSGDGIHFPHPGQMVSVHYDAFIVNGKQWDSTRGPGRGQPLRFRLGKGQVIPGLDEGVGLSFNTLKGTPVSKFPVFGYTCDEAQIWREPINGTVYTVPDQLSVHSDPSAHFMMSSKVSFTAHQHWHGTLIILISRAPTPLLCPTCASWRAWLDPYAFAHSLRSLAHSSAPLARSSLRSTRAGLRIDRGFPELRG